LLLVFICLFPWARDLYAILAQPMIASMPVGGRLIATEVTAPFFVPVKVTMMAAFVIALPYLLYQVWAFVAPGLYAHERKLVAPLIITSTLLFICGMAFAYYLVFPVVFHFMVSVAPEGVAVMTDIGKYLDFVLSLFLAFGVTFEVPVAVVILVRMGLVSVKTLKEIRPVRLDGLIPCMPRQLLELVAAVRFGTLADVDLDRHFAAVTQDFKCCLLSGFERRNQIQHAG
jgi:sec-independent protein translocase protein TatC